MNDSLSILVPSWGGAQEIWMPFSECIRKNWHSCPFPIYLLTESKTIEGACFSKIMHSDTDSRNVVGRIQSALNDISTPYVMLLIDDYFCFSEIKTEIISDALTFMKDNNIEYLDLDNKKGIPKYLKKPGPLFMISVGVPCIFKTDFLRKVLNNITAKTIREFEVHSSEYVYSNRDSLKIYTVKNSNFYFLHGILEGFWRFKAVRLMKRNNIKLSYNRYKKFSPLHSVKAVVKALVFNVVLKCFPGLLDRFYRNSNKWIIRY